MLSLCLPACREQLFFWTRCSMQRISIFMCRKPFALSCVEQVSGSRMLVRTTLRTRGMWRWDRDMLGPWLGMMSWVLLSDCPRLLHLFCFLKYLLCDCLWNSVVDTHYRKSVDMRSIGKRRAGWGTGSSPSSHFYLTADLSGYNTLWSVWDHSGWKRKAVVMLRRFPTFKFTEKCFQAFKNRDTIQWSFRENL